jgi:hypothetical protein
LGLDFKQETEQMFIVADKDRLAYRMNEFALLTGLSLRQVKTEIYSGNLGAIRKGKIVLIPAESARAYLASDGASPDPKAKAKRAEEAAK